MMARSAMNISNKPRLALDVCDVVLCLVLTAACAYIAAGGFYETLSSLCADCSVFANLSAGEAIRADFTIVKAAFARHGSSR